MKKMINPTKRGVKRALAVILCLTIALSAFSITAFMATDDEMNAALSKAKSYIDSLTINSSTNKPASVVSTYGSHFTWDNEKRESNNKSYLYEWSYYNGVVFEGLEYIYDYTGDESYYNYVQEYMSTMISSDGSWAKTSNNSSKESAGYVDYHGADCYKTASLLLDMAKKADGTIDTTSKYYKTATSLYNDLTTGTGSNYTDSAVGNNYWHSNWSSSSAPAYKVWLDGLYMIQPFMAEYAYYTGDTAQLNEIVGRFEWLYNNSRSSSNGLYYHAINSTSSYVDYYWTRALGWYGMAVVDVMQYLTGDNLESMKVILKDFVDNVIKYQDSTTGMWANLCDKSVTSTNRLETSGTAMIAYIIAKGINDGNLDSSYFQYAKKAFKGMVDNKLVSSQLTDIYFKASANGTDNYTTSSYYYTDEGKGVGPFIMAYAQVLEAFENEQNPLYSYTDQATGVSVFNTRATALTVTDVSTDSTISEALTSVSEKFKAYDITLSDYTQGEAVEVSLPIPSDYDEQQTTVYYVAADGALTKIDSTNSNGKAVFTADHFSVYAVAQSDSSFSIDDVNWVLVDAYKVTPVNIYVRTSAALVNGSSYLLGYLSSNSGTIINQTAGVQSVTSKNAGVTDYYSTADGTTLYTAGSEYIIGNETIDNCAYTRSGSYLVNDYNSRYLNRSGTTAVTTATSSPTTWVFAANRIYTTYSSRSRYLYAYNSTSFRLSTSTQYIYGYAKTTVYERTGNPEESGYYGLSGKMAYEVPIGSGFNASSIFEGTSILFKDSQEGTPTAVDWADSTVTYAWDNAVNTAVAGTYTMNVFVNDVKIGSVDVTVSQDDYPEYPNYGSIEIEKYAISDGTSFQDTGVAEVNLTIKGIPSTAPIDVLFVTDVSNSMAWVAGTNTTATTGQSSKLNDVQEAVSAFSSTFLSNNIPNGSKNNTISFATFAGLDKDHTQNTSSITSFSSYTDSTRTLFVNNEDASSVAQEVNKLTFSYENSNYYLSFDGSVNTSTDLNYGNTNYDYAFMQAEHAISEIKSEFYAKNGISYDSSERQIYVIFMTDGAPTNYNGVYYNHPTSSTRPDYNATWTNSSGNEVTYTLGNGGTAKYSQSAWYNFINTNDHYWATQVYNTAGVLGMSSVGVDMENGGFSDWQFTEASGYSLESVLNGMVTGQTIETFLVDNQEALAEYLIEKANLLKDAGSDAYVVDVMGAAYDLQMSSLVNCGIAENGVLNLSDYGVSPSVKILMYDVYNLSDVGTVVNGETVTTAMIGQRKGTAPTVLETVTFNTDGTQAYSSLLSGNILRDGVIYAKYFTFNATAEDIVLTNGQTLTSETFYWDLGDIPEDEIVLSYNVYLSDSMQGERPSGAYDTNTRATLYYTNYLGNDCEKDFPIPTLPWEDAKLNYELYLVNEDGAPINASGDEVSFENRVLMSELQTLEKYLNTATVIDFEILEALLPDGYGLYNSKASYTGIIASGNALNKSTVSDSSNTTVVYSPAGATIGNDGTVNGLTDYRDIHVAFAIVRIAIYPDVVVLDYGKTISISPLDNDKGAYEIVGLTEFDSAMGTALSNSVKGSNGVFKVDGENVIYSPFKYMSSIDRVNYYVSGTSEGGISANSLTSTISVIPATTVYYEDNFGGSEENGGLYINYTGDWYTVDDSGNQSSGVSANVDTNNRQDNGEIGKENTPYGYDSSYDNDIHFSNGSAAKATGSVSLVNGRPQFDASASFTFTGTGFDIISRTDLDCGMITVYVVDANGKGVNVPVINKGSGTLYQIPVISYTGLAYGTYTVTINVNAPVSALGITGSVFYLDAIRIYDPMGTSQAENEEFNEANAAYNEDGEANAYTASIRDYILQAGQLDVSETYGAVWVDTINNDYDGGGFIEQSTIEDFELTGPNEEVYLSPGYGIGFIIEATEIPESIQLEIKVPAPLKNGATLSVQTYNQLSSLANFEVASATEMFYDITDSVIFVPVVENGEVLYRATVILANGLPSKEISEIVSITNVKMTYKDDVQVLDANAAEEMSFDAAEVLNLETVSLKASWNLYVNVFDTVYVQHQASMPDYSVSSAKALNSVKNAQSVSAVIKTSRHVEALEIIDENGSKVKILSAQSVLDESKRLTADYKDAKTWTVEFIAYGSSGVKDYIAKSASGDGDTAAFSVTIQNPTVESIRVYTKPSKTSYKYGEAFNPDGMKLQATYSDGSVKVIDSGFSYSSDPLKKNGTEKINVYYGGQQTSVDVTVRYSVIQIIAGIFGFGWLWK